MDVLYRNIKARREELGMSQDELAKKLNYKSRSSINKIELGINDLPQSKIKEFAEVLNTTVSALMGWDLKASMPDDYIPSLNEQVEYTYGYESVEMLEVFNQLNDLGKSKAIETVGDLTEIPKYTKEKPKYIYRAARSTNNADAEILERDEKTMEKLKAAKKITSDEDI